MEQHRRIDIPEEARLKGCIYANVADHGKRPQARLNNTKYPVGMTLLLGKYVARGYVFKDVTHESKKLEHSHLCHDYFCVNPDHGCLETNDLNQGRKACSAQRFLICRCRKVPCHNMLPNLTESYFHACLGREQALPSDDAYSEAELVDQFVEKFRHFGEQLPQWLEERQRTQQRRRECFQGDGHQ